MGRVVVLSGTSRVDLSIMRSFTMNAELVRAQLDRILASAAFTDAERARRFLRHVVNCALEGRTEVDRDVRTIALDDQGGAGADGEARRPIGEQGGRQARRHKASAVNFRSRFNQKLRPFHLNHLLATPHSTIPFSKGAFNLPTD